MPKIINVPKMVQRCTTNGSKPSHIKQSLEVKPDIIDISTKKPDKNSGFYDFFDLAMTSLGLVVGVKKAIELPAINSNMTFGDVNTHFRDIFLNDNLSLGETVVMINRYKALDEIEDDEEYIKAVFEEAKANYGLQKTMSSLKLVDEISKNPNQKIDGFADPICNVTISTNNRTRLELFKTVHHELRHVKQHVYAFNYDPETYVKYSQPKNFEMPQEYFEYFIGCEPSMENIPKNKRGYAKKCIEGLKAYKSASKGINDYSVQFVEKDAFSAGNRIGEIMQIL